MQKIGDIPNTRADSNGEFTDGNVAGGIPPTILPAEWFNTIQRELMSILNAAEIEADSDAFDQVLLAIQKLVSEEIPEVKDGSLTQKGVVQLSSSTTSVSEIFAATPKAVKDMGDKALKTTNNLSEIAAAGSVAQAAAQVNIGVTGGLGASVIGRLIAKRSITSTGVIPKATGAKWAIIRAWSAGGGGGGAGRTVTAGNASQGWAGQSGSFIEVLVDVSGLSNYDCSIGLGGTGGAASNVNAGNPGLDGGSTIIAGILSCPGGKGGQPGVLGTTNNTGIAIVGTALPTATLGTILDSSVSDIGAPGSQVGTGPNQSLGCRGGSAPGGLGSVGGQAGRPIDAGTDGTGGDGKGHAAGGGGGSSVSNTTGYGGGNGTGGFISITEFA
ncbi:TPA: tail fiber protein [Yersinia enterocolitica]|nr:bacteriophage tail fiber protein [Yersinia enterocolitica]CQJ13961.1 bacteriophage tail fiber protein [Yersinia enterocolitica]CQJ61790.1 bacteriophage tail fiber protein [Yersinia enterocolitica]CQQ65221.1 bacteriophage tail fiber protein [Yersinia enterocolitica]CRX40222.1 bacteriophage tail fiber protein [Yersinia enterocolitica]